MRPIIQVRAHARSGAAPARPPSAMPYTAGMTDPETIRRRWLERLGRPVHLAFPFAAVEDVFPRGRGVSMASVEIGAGSISIGDRLVAAGYTAAPVPVMVAGIDLPVPERRGVQPVERATAGAVVGLDLRHDPSSAVLPGQCLAPAGRLAVASGFEADVWCLAASELPGSPGEQQALCDAIASGTGLDVFVHARALGARTREPWRPSLGDEAVVRIELSAPVAVYPGTRFGLRYEGLTFGAGFVRAGA